MLKTISDTSKNTPNGECKKQMSIRLYPGMREALIKDFGSVQAGLDFYLALLYPEAA